MLLCLKTYFLLYVLHKCGWIVSSSKHGPVSQQKQFLGLIVNTVSIKFEIPEEKLKCFIHLANSVLSLKTAISVRLLAKVLGILNSFSRALGQVVRLMTRSLYQCLLPAYQGKLGWESDTQLSGAACEELKFWIDNIESIKGFFCLQNFLHSLPAKLLPGMLVALVTIPLNFLLPVKLW